MALHVEVVSPERILWSGEAGMVTARTVGGGDISFLTGHAPFVGALDVGRVVVRPTEGPIEVIAVHGGFVEVNHDRVTLLSDVAELASQIDVERARRAQERAEAALREGHHHEAEAALRRAHVRLDVAGGLPAGAGH
ncbi:MAG: ATP synthase F1 subunit epsilon [Acidimicrobiia bacterium]